MTAVSDIRGIANFARILMAIGLSAVLRSPEALAQPFYAGKTLKIIVGFPPGGGYDLYARAFAKFLPAHIAGNPTVVVTNMPGAGSLVAANYIANLAPKDGTEIGSVETFIPFEAYYKGPGVRFDPLKLSWLGALNAEMTTCVVWHESKVQTFSDLLLTNVPFGATGSGAPPVVEPKIMNSVLGTRIKLVTGYQGMADIFVAMENREVDGSCGINWSTLTATHADWLAQQKIRLIVQNAFDRHPDVKHVPLLLDFAKTEKQKGVLTLLAAPNRVGRPYMAPPGISHERLAVLRKALDDTVRDPQFLAEAARLKLSVNAVSGEDVHGVFQAAAKVDQSMVNEMISARGN